MGPIRRTGVVIAVCLAPAGVSASTFAPVSDAQLVRESTDIVQGRIVAVKSAWDDDGVAIWTVATVEVRRVLKGVLTPGVFVDVREVGGRVDGYTIKAHGFPAFIADEEVVMLLRPWDEDPGMYRVWGYGRGMYSILRGKGRAPVAYRFDVVQSGRPTMHLDRIAPVMQLEQLERTLRALAAGR